jgi:hypothetical protein
MCNSKDLSEEDTFKLVDYFAYIQNEYNKEVDIYRCMKSQPEIWSKDTLIAEKE